MPNVIEKDTTIPFSSSGERLDRALALLFPEFSRAKLQEWIRGGQVLLDGKPAPPKTKLRGGERVTVRAQLVEETQSTAEPVDFSVVHCDGAVVVVDKPAGLVVHPGAGNRTGTLVNGLLHRFPELALLPRAGLVHRLDKDTSGLLVVARTLQAHSHLVRQLARRTISREYDALVHGSFVSGGTVDAPIGRHPVDRLKMAVVANGRSAVTHYSIAQRFVGATLLRVSLETGRTHQIRVHMAHIGHPIVGDPVYGGRRLIRGMDESGREALRRFRRQALHAARLVFSHPVSGEQVECEAPRPADFAGLLHLLKPERA